MLYIIILSGYHYNFFYTLPDLFSLYQNVTRTLFLSTGSIDKTTNTYTTRTWRSENYFCRVVTQTVEGYLV